MSIFRILAVLIFLPLGYACGNNDSVLKSSGYYIHMGENETDKKWSEFLYNNLIKYTDYKGIITKHKKENYKTIEIQVNENLENDYCIVHQNDAVILKAKNESNIEWLIYQFIALVSECDERIIASEIPPAIIKCETQCRNFNFVYREPHFSPNLRYDYVPMIGTNIVERDWGIWGHNLSKVLHNGKNDSVYARQGEVVNYEQFCFSSNETFRQIKEYIIDNYGNSKDYIQWFMIMPNDNNIVCQCHLCQKNGNTATNATPAVTTLIQKLSKDFPYHQFFTTAYITTLAAPQNSLPANTGVMVSTIELPKGTALNSQKEVSMFLATCSNWGNTTPNVYIWDYAANFDDYLTPIPVLYGLKKQLQFYKSNGITGVFLNASGYDYSPFDDVKTYVSAALMMNTDYPVDSLCKAYYHKFYPVAGKLLTSYYLSLEKDFEKKDKPYSMYAGFPEISRTYFDAEKFVEFYNELASVIEKTTGEEKEKLQKLYTALTYTRLQVAYYQINGKNGFATINNKVLTAKPEIKTMLAQLMNYKQYKDLINYKETRGELKTYIDNWDLLTENKGFNNLLLGEPLKVVSKLDEEYQQTNVLNDGVLGFPTEYHQGWHISSVDLHVQLNAKNLQKAKNICMRFMNSKRHKIYPPGKIEIFKDKKLYKTITNLKTQDNIEYLDEKIDLNNAEQIEIIIYKKPDTKSTLACDEIQLTGM